MMMRSRFGLITNDILVFFLAATAYFAISVLFLFRLISSFGNAAQQDWGIPLTAQAAYSDLHSLFFAWQYTGFGGPPVGYWGLPYFQFLNAALAPLGFFGGTEVKELSVSLVALAGIAAYVLCKSFGLRFFSSFLSGLFFMATPLVFNWLTFGFIYYLIAYDLLPIMILITRKYLENSDLRYALINGVIFSVVLEQATFIVLYPLLWILFVLFESRGKPKIILRGLFFTFVSLSVWFLTALSFFTTFNKETFSFYQGSFFGVINAQYSHLSSLLNPIRLWGSTYNFQFETYFPKELALLSFIPALLVAFGILLKPRDRHVLFFSLAFLFVFVAYESYNNLHYIVYNLPFGAVFEAPSIFLVPASLGIAVLVGYVSETISRPSARFDNGLSRDISRIGISLLILILIISAGIPWWAGQASGTPIPGPPTKLNLYQIPSGYMKWSAAVPYDNENFVLYAPLNGNAQIMNTSYFSGSYEGVNYGIFTQVNNLPYISVFNNTQLLNELFSGSSTVGESWGLDSIKYIVVYTNVESTYNMSNLLNLLSRQNGIVKVANLSDVVVYQDEYAKPVAYANSSNATTQIIYHDPTSYKVLASSTSPYLLVLNQAYSSGWLASVNGTTLPSADHEKVNGFNVWFINYTGTMTINIHYGPQMAFLVSTMVSVGVLLVVLLFVGLATVIDVRAKKVDIFKTD